MHQRIQTLTFHSAEQAKIFLSAFTINPLKCTELHLLLGIAFSFKIQNLARPGKYHLYDVWESAAWLQLSEAAQFGPTTLIQIQFQTRPAGFATKTGYS